jgi:hypothetical protein
MASLGIHANFRRRIVCEIAGTYILSGILLIITGGLVRERDADRDNADDRVVRDLLLRLRRCQRGLPDGERDLPDGDARDGDRVLLRDRHARGPDRHS